MKRKPKIFLTFLAAAVLFSGLSLAGLVYVYRHPSLSKAFLERAVSNFGEANLRIERLSYSAFPLSLQAEGVRLKAEGKVVLSVPELALSAHRTGGLGEGTLVIDSLRVENPVVRLDRDRLAALATNEKGGGSLLSRVGRKLVGLFLFRRVEVRDLEAANGILNLRLAGQTLALGDLSVRMSPDRSVLISFRADLDGPEKKVKVSAPTVRIALDPFSSLEEPEITGSWTVEDGAASGPIGSAEGLASEGRFAYRVDSRALDLKAFRLGAEKVSMDQGAASLPPGLSLRVEGKGAVTEGGVRLSALRVEAPGLFEAEGSLEAVPAEPLVRATVSHGRFWPESILPGLIKTMTGLPESSVRLSGPFSFSGTALGRVEGGRLRWECGLAAGMDKNELAFSSGGANLSLPLSGTVRLSGAYPELAAEASLETKDASFERDGLKLEGVGARLALGGTYPSYTVKELDVELPARRGEADLFRSLQVEEGKGKINAQAGVFEIEEAKIESPLLGTLSLALSGGPERVRLTLSGKGAGLIQWPKRLGLVPAEVEVSGLGSVALEAAMDGNDRLTAKAAVSFSDVGFQDPDFTYTAQGIDLRSEMTGTLKVKEGSAQVRGSLAAEKGELLLGRFYFDLGGEHLKATLDGGFDFNTGRLRIAKLQAGLKNLIALQLKGSMRGAAPSTDSQIDLTLPETDLAPIFNQFVKAPYRNEKPFLDDLRPSGRVSANLRLRMEKGRRALTGFCRLKGGGLDTEREDLRLRGVDLSLPIRLQEAETTGIPEPLRGRIAVESLQLPLLPAQSVNLPLLAFPNRLSSPSPVAIRGLGGRIQLGPSTLSALNSGSPRLRTSLTVRSIDLGRILSPFWGRPVSSEVNGRLDPVLVETGALVAKGKLKADIFGGEASVENIRLSRLGAQWPDIRLDARISDLNLEDLTKETPFGKIEGVLRGEINGLEIAYGQPQRFDLLLETVKKKGTEQKISLKAVDNISRLGGGGSPFVGLAGAFASLFKSFPYEKIGVAAHLENDLFTVNGTIKEDGREYLVKRAAFSGVNVINQNPDNRISFKDMVNRLKRVASDGGGPVVR